MPRHATAGFGFRKSSFWFCVATGIPMSLHGPQILSNKSCRNMAFFGVTGNFMLLHSWPGWEDFMS